MAAWSRSVPPAKELGEQAGFFGRLREVKIWYACWRCRCGYGGYFSGQVTFFSMVIVWVGFIGF